MHSEWRSACFIVCYCLTHCIDVGDARILSEPEISADVNQLLAALMFKLPPVPMNFNVNDWLVREIYLKGNPLRGCR